MHLGKKVSVQVRACVGLEDMACRTAKRVKEKDYIKANFHFTLK